jgi:hypothetical protein
VNPYEWIERYGRAWETADKELTLSLFTEDAVYRSQIFREFASANNGRRRLPVTPRSPSHAKPRQTRRSTGIRIDGGLSALGQI